MCNTKVMTFRLRRTEKNDTGHKNNFFPAHSLFQYHGLFSHLRTNEHKFAMEKQSCLLQAVQQKQNTYILYLTKIDYLVSWYCLTSDGQSRSNMRSRKLPTQFSVVSHFWSDGGLHPERNSVALISRMQSYHDVTGKRVLNLELVVRVSRISQPSSQYCTVLLNAIRDL